MMYQGKPVRWFKVTSRLDPNVNGTYCEPCLVVAHYVKNQQTKQGPSTDG